MRRLACALALLLPFAFAEAITFTVTNTNDAGPGSLRDAIAQANLNVGADNIVFAPGVTGTITLTSGQFQIAGEVTITGPGASNLTINADGKSRVFSIFATDPACPAVDGPDYLVTITGLRLVNSFLTFANNGGAIFSEHSLAVDGVVFDTGIAARGGGIAMVTQYPGQSLTIANSQFVNNFARPRTGVTGISAFGGAVAVFERCGNTRNTPVPVTITRSVFSNNTTLPSDSFGNGGALGFDGFADVTISETRIVDNRLVVSDTPLANTVYAGGGVWARALSFTLSSSEVSGNAAFDPNVSADTTRGGGMWIGNTAGQTGADRMKARIVNSTISANQSNAGTGGAMIVNSNIDAEIYNSTVAGNQAASGRTGGILVTAGTGSALPGFKLVSAIVANSTGSDFATNTATFPTYVLDATSSLVKALCSTCQITVGGTGNLIGIDPLLSGLAFNGGSTRTQALLPGSPALNMGLNPLNLATDQRGTGYPRTVAGATDMGAYEATDTPPPPVNNLPIPTLSEYALALLALLLAGLGAVFVRRRA